MVVPGDTHEDATGTENRGSRGANRPRERGCSPARRAAGRVRVVRRRPVHPCVARSDCVCQTGASRARRAPRPPTAGRPRSSPTRSGSRRRAAGRSIARSATVTATTSATAPPIAEIGVGRDSRVPGCRCWFRAREPVDESLAGRQQSVGASVADASGLDHWWLPSPSDGRPRMQCPPRTYPDVTTAVAATSAAAVMAGGDRRGRSVRCP